MKNKTTKYIKQKPKKEKAIRKERRRGKGCFFWHVFPATLCMLCGRPGFDPWVRKNPKETHGNPLQDSCLENPMDRGAWQAAVHGAGRVGHDLATKPSPPPPRKHHRLSWGFLLLLLWWWRQKTDSSFPNPQSLKIKKSIRFFKAMQKHGFSWPF